MMKKDQITEIAERAADWPEQAREELVTSMLSIEARYYGVYVTNSEDRRALKQSGDDMQHNRFANEEDIAKVFHRFNRTA